MKKFLYALGALVVLLLCAFGFALANQTSPRAQPAVIPGHTTASIQVPHRKVPVHLDIWYPTDATTAPVLLAQNALFYGAWVRPDAPGQRQPAPVVLLSHGSGGNAERLGWIASQLAASGMVVVAPNHPGTTSNDSDPFQTVKTWERPADLTAALDFILATPPLGITADPARVAVMGYSLGGYAALGLSGVRLSKSAFIDYCGQNPDELDCGWMLKAGVDFATIDQSRYEQSNRDPRVTVTVAIDPALPAAMVPESLEALATKTLILNLGSPDTLPQGLKSDANAALIPGAAYHAIPGAHHFSFLPECSGLGFVIIGLAGDDNICSDWGFADRAAVHSQVAAHILPFLQTGFGLPPG